MRPMTNSFVRLNQLAGAAEDFWAARETRADHPRRFKKAKKALHRAAIKYARRVAREDGEPLRRDQIADD